MKTLRPVNLKGEKAYQKLVELGFVETPMVVLESLCKKDFYSQKLVS